MKRFLLSFVAVVGLLATSCVQDATSDMELNKQGVVTFAVDAQHTSRAYGVAAEANDLYYAVYQNGQLLDAISVIPGVNEPVGLINGATNVSLSLATGLEYEFVFWAASPAAISEGLYTIDWANKTMTLNANALVASDESLDAFYKYDKFVVNGTATHPMILKRPFAQINVATGDTEKATNAGLTVAETWFEVSGAFDTLNLATGIASGAATLNYTAAVKPASTEKITANSKDYDLLGVIYVLANATESPLNNVKFSYNRNAGEVAAVKSVEVPSAPIKRNARTNLVGNILTSNNGFDVDIDEGFEDTYVDGIFVSNGEYHITNVNGLKALANEVEKDGLDGKTIILDGDIDLAATRSASNWTPIGTSEKPFLGTFDGKGYTIKNLNIVEEVAKEGKAYIGFFGYAKNATIKNVTFENVNLNIPCLDIDHSQGHIGAVAGSLEGTSTIENVTVKGDIKVYATQNANGASRVAVIAGGNSYGNVTMENVHVIANEGSYLIANNNTGALAGQLQGKSVCKNCSSNIDVTVNKFFAGGLIGLAAGDQLFENCHTTGDIAVVAGREGRAHDQYRVGGIAGGWADGAKNVCTLVNCSYTGKVSGKNSDGSVAKPLDYLGYVGRGYTLNGCAGSKVVIDGIEFVQIGNTAAEAGIYNVTNAEGEAVAVAATQSELESAVTAGGEVILTAGEYTFPASRIQAGTTINCAEGTIFTGKSSLDIKGATVIGATFKNEGDIAVSGTIYGTLKDCTFEGEEALRWCYTAAGTTVVFENCVINNDFRGFHFDDMNGDVLFKNCHINGFNAYGGEGTATFEGCTFGTDDRSPYNGLNIYANTVLTDCTFIYKSGKTNFIDIEAAGKSLTITNCTATLDGAAANVADFVGGSKLQECTVTIEGEIVAKVGWSLVNGYSKLFVNAEKSEYTVFSAEGLIQLNNYWAANAYSNHMWGKTYSIGADIDATGHTWNSVFVIVGNNANNGFVIDGKGHTISNLAINGSLFTGTPNGGNADTTPGVVRNLTFDNATVANGGYGAAVIWGNTYGEVTFEDVHIVNSSVTGVCNVAAFVGATTIEDGGTINPVKFINCSVENCTITAIGGDGCDPTGASGYVGRAFAKTSIVFEGTNTIDAATVINNAEGLVGGRVYGYTTWANGGFSGTGICDEFVNWNGLN